MLKADSHLSPSAQMARCAYQTARMLHAHESPEAALSVVIEELDLHPDVVSGLSGGWVWVSTMVAGEHPER